MNSSQINYRQKTESVSRKSGFICSQGFRFRLSNESVILIFATSVYTLIGIATCEMKVENSIRIFPSRFDWSETIEDIASVPRNVINLRLVSKSKGLERLSLFTKLKRLWCFNINPESLGYICDCASLEELFIESFKSDSFSCLRKLVSLKVLSIDRSSKISSLNDLSNLQSLEGLAIINFKNVHEINSLSKLINLRQLAVAGSIWTRMKIESLKPLSSLLNLRYLHLTNLKAEDESLKPLAELNQLKKLEIANFYPMEEVAWLAGRLKETECSWFRPYIELPFECPKCKKDLMVMLTGKGKPNLCKECDANRLAKHVAKFEEIAVAA